ncbi:putative short-subunit dehydrogenase-like oxidoreductase (DUF2520 family) [Mucilaginibacter yixingensis]|uniref:Putative short-subunit dehydrogenase-like oxidoreductase (DUF2520 family) n=1 Tax=Mucilaginibacter yixingensis TaxID=1295612 RepID=A0A2T5J5T0_9SPHI|nr:Rossmann-like and DUF2520 domain-containing protein [Mucilaginibacter yixingensis]PTQ93623.1 putative short-subunit dehydrogenase-like oxidoreductase (DUF2520 family) [Mucilaginibacter yixingensis]
MRITIIGSGNVATHLAAAFKNAGHNIVQVYSRNMQNAALLAYHVKAEPIDSLEQINPKTDLFVISVKDDVIGELAWELARYQKLMVHTSGATGLQKLLAYTENAGVFYPLQTFSKTKELDFWQVPLCLEGADVKITKKLETLARTISNNVYRVDSAQCKVLHLSAVFACNFPNYLYDVARQLLQKSELPFDMLRPLIAETAAKVMEQLPADVQTGPAIRNDLTTMNAHLQMLDGEHDLQQVYELLSQGIIKMDKGEVADG